MKNKFILLIFLLTGFACSINAQELEKNEVDEFTGKKTIETSWEKLAWGMGVPSGIYARIRSIDGTMILDMKYMIDDACVISKDDKLMLMDEKGKVHSVYPTKLFHGTKGGGSIGIVGSSLWGIYVHYYGNMNFLKNNKITKIRIYTSDGYYEKEIKKKYQETLSKLFQLVVEAEYNKCQ